MCLMKMKRCLRLAERDKEWFKASKQIGNAKRLLKVIRLKFNRINLLKHVITIN